MLSFPYPLRFLFATRPAVLTQVLGIVYRAVSTFLVRRAGLHVGTGARTGAFSTTHVVLDPIDFMRHIPVPHPFGPAPGCAKWPHNQ